MLTTQRRATAHLIERLLRQPYRFQFFQAVRLLELCLQRGAAGAGRTLDGVLRFRNSIALHFPPSQLEAVTLLNHPPPAGTDDETDRLPPDMQRVRQIRMTPAFMGFLGVNGLLPHDYTATIAAQIAVAKNEAGRAFFDNFSHRSMLLFYRAWAICRIECRDPEQFLAMQMALAGGRHRPAAMRATGAAIAPALSDEVVARYAALIRHRPLQADMLAGVLGDYFGVPFRVQPLVGAWIESAATCSMLGTQNSLLGRDMLLGGRYWRRDASMRLWIGPLSLVQFEGFLPGGSAASALKALLSLFALPTVAFELRPVLRAVDVEPAALDGRTALGRASIVLTVPQSIDHDGASYRIAFSRE